MHSPVCLCSRDLHVRRGGRKRPGSSAVWERAQGSGGSSGREQKATHGTGGCLSTRMGSQQELEDGQERVGEG